MSFSDSIINQVWNMARRIPGEHSNVKRRDKCGATIAKSAYGDHNSRFGWDIDHIYPVSQGGTDQVHNLQPLHWENNLSKGDGPDNPRLYCVVKN